MRKGYEVVWTDVALSKPATGKYEEYDVPFTNSGNKAFSIYID